MGVDDFLSAHPEYDTVHAHEIAMFAESESIPYCVFCHDWHHFNEEHSS